MPTLVTPAVRGMPDKLTSSLQLTATVEEPLLQCVKQVSAW